MAAGAMAAGAMAAGATHTCRVGCRVRKKGWCRAREVRRRALVAALDVTGTEATSTGCALGGLTLAGPPPPPPPRPPLTCRKVQKGVWRSANSRGSICTPPATVSCSHALPYFTLLQALHGCCAASPAQAPQTHPPPTRHRPAILVHRPQLGALLVHARGALVHVVSGQVHKYRSAAPRGGPGTMVWGGRRAAAAAVQLQRQGGGPPAVARRVALHSRQQLGGDVDGARRCLALTLACRRRRLRGAVDDPAG